MYHCPIEYSQWLSYMVEQGWKVHNSNMDGGKSWNVVGILISKFPILSKVFISRALNEGLHLRLALKRHRIAISNCFFALLKWKTILIISYSIQLLARFELHFLDLASFVTSLFDIKAMGVCTTLPKIREGDHFPTFEILGIASQLGYAQCYCIWW